MKKIAVTGGIASGKSVVCDIIENLGYTVIYTDKINSELLADAEYQKKLALIFPSAIKNGIVDKKYIRNEILQDDSKRLALNALAHSEIKTRVLNMLEKVDTKAIFVEIPLIVESGMKDYFDQIWCVVADIDTKIKRIEQRDNVSSLDAQKIIQCQKKDSELISIADIVIENNGDLNKLKEEVGILICTAIK